MGRQTNISYCRVGECFKNSLCRAHALTSPVKGHVMMPEQYKLRSFELVWSTLCRRIYLLPVATTLKKPS